MQWRLPKIFKEVVRVVYVPVPSYGKYEDLWATEGYINEVRSLAGTVPYVVEMTQLLKEVRDRGDAAKSGDELSGIRDCIEIIKKRLVMSEIAGAQLENIKIKKEIEAATE